MSATYPVASIAVVTLRGCGRRLVTPSQSEVSNLQMHMRSGYGSFNLSPRHGPVPMEVSAYAHQPSANHSAVACGRYLSECTCVGRAPVTQLYRGSSLYVYASSFRDGISAASRV
jgi:hypothetical protein